MTFCLGQREFVGALGGAAAWPLAVRAQQRATPVRRVGVLMSIASDDPEAQLRVAAFEAGLRDLGWVQGCNLHIEYRWAAAQTDVLRPQAAELVASVPDLILATSTPATIVLREQTRTLPIVFVFVNDPVGQGFVSSLPHPGGNLTGFTTFEFAIGTKWLEGGLSCGEARCSDFQPSDGPLCWIVPAADRGRGAILLGRADPIPDARRRRDQRERSIGLYASRMVDYWYCHISLSWLASAAQSP